MPAERFPVEAGHIMMFARAIADPNPIYRDAEYAASTGTNSSDALTKAQRTICLQAQNIPGFLRSGLASPNDVNQCTRPTVSIVSFALSTDPAVGASTRFPIASVTVRATVPFSPLFAYPFLTNNGTWTVTSQVSFSVSQGRT